MLELPFKRLLLFIEEIKNAPTSFSGKIGRQLKNIDKTSDVANFITIQFDLVNMIEDLHGDSKYLYDICVTISTYTFTESMLKRSPGKMHHAR